MTQERAAIHAYYAAHGYLVMASLIVLPHGQLERNDWNENYMQEHRWSVVGNATRAELEEQNKITGYEGKIDPRYRFFYRVVAMD